MALKRLYGESDGTYNQRNGMTGYTYENEAQKNALRDQYTNREDFKYDLGDDMLYQQAKEQYMALGKTAMQDTVARASAMTGGYGNSYATSAGNQAYNGYLQQLNNNIPDYYAMALDTYSRQGQELANKYNILANESTEGYNRYASERAYLNDLAGMESSDARSTQSFDESKRQYEAQMAYQKQRDAVSDSQWQKKYDLSKTSTAASKTGSASVSSGSSKAQSYTQDEYDDILNIYQTSGANAAKKKISALGTAKGWDEDICFSLMESIQASGKMSLLDRNWTVENNGGNNWGGGIDNNAKVKDQNGNVYRMDQLYKELQQFMDKTDAKNWILNLQKETGITK